MRAAGQTLRHRRAALHQARQRDAHRLELGTVGSGEEVAHEAIARRGEALDDVEARQRALRADGIEHRPAHAPRLGQPRHGLAVRTDSPRRVDRREQLARLGRIRPEAHLHLRLEARRREIVQDHEVPSAVTERPDPPNIGRRQVATSTPPNTRTAATAVRAVGRSPSKGTARAVATSGCR